VKVVALVGDLMDRTRLGAQLPDATFAAEPASCAGAAVVIVDAERHGGAIEEIRAVAPAAAVIAYGPHVDAEVLAAARADGAALALPRSRFFRDPAAAIRVALGGAA
jgi:DNA-binding NarL/FixJ family response regulator